MMEQVNKEYRAMTMEIRAAEQTEENKEMVLEGYAIRFNDKTMLYEYGDTKYYEIIDSKALNDTDMKDVPFKYNHSDNFMILGRTRSKTLELTIDSVGLKIKAILPNSPSGQDLYESVKRRDIDKMSFAFTASEEKYDYNSHTRTVLKIKKLWDISAVVDPAYKNTSLDVSARDYFSTLAEAEKRAKDEKEKLRQELLLKTYL